MNWLEGFDGAVTDDAPLAKHTSFRLGGPAAWMVSPRNETALSDLIHRARTANIEMKILGRGANVLVSDAGFDGVVVRLDADTFTASRFEAGAEGEASAVVAGGGVDLYTLAGECARRGLAGLEALAGIPATLGGAVRMNAGGKYGDIAGVVESVTVVDSEGNLKVQPRNDCAFGYRRSNLEGSFATSVRLQLQPEDPARTLERFHSIWEEKKASQPFSHKSAGCIFKNPEGTSAGALIDQAGLKGTSCGAAVVSEKHANFIVTSTDTTSDDVLALIDTIKDTVKRRFDIELETEIDVWTPVGAGVGRTL